MSQRVPGSGPRYWVALGLLVIIVIAIHAVDSDRRSVILGALRNAGHLPLFMLVAASAWRISGAKVLKAVTISMAIALTAELSQIQTGGETDWRDFGVDMIGITLGLIATLLWQRRGTLPKAAACGSMLLGCVPLIGWSITWHQRAVALPCLADFDNAWLSSVQRPMGAEVVETSPDRIVLALASEGYAGLRLLDPIADWTDFGALDLRFEVSPATRVTVRIHDETHNHEHADRFNRTYDQSTVADIITLSEVRDAPATRAMALHQIEALTLFVFNAEPGSRLTVYTPCLIQSP